MIKLGIIGYPLGHSLSPVMHNAALDYLGIKGEFCKLETKPDELINRLKYLKVQNFTGFNVTIPLKVWITPLLHEVDDHANVSGAVNTVVINNDKTLSGYNTDIYGFIESIPENLRNQLIGTHAAILGSGGATRAVAVGLAAIGVSNITLFARNLEKADNLKEIISANFPNIKIQLRKFDEYMDLSFASILINATPIGMQGIDEDLSPISKRSIESLSSNSIVYDLIYKPKATKLLSLADDRGLITINGIEMLVLQGAKALSLWLKQRPPTDVMREAVLKHL